MKILGIILAGGLSTRMEGQDKALLSLAGSPLSQTYNRSIRKSGRRLSNKC